MASIGHFGIRSSVAGCELANLAKRCVFSRFVHSRFVVFVSAHRFLTNRFGFQFGLHERILSKFLVRVNIFFKIFFVRSKNTNSIGAGKIPRGTTITPEVDFELQKNAKASNMTLTNYVRELMRYAAEEGITFRKGTTVIIGAKNKVSSSIGDQRKADESASLALNEAAQEYVLRPQVDSPIDEVSPPSRTAKKPKDDRR